jgi:hypothetical protein
MADKIVVHLDGPRITLRVDEMIDGEIEKRARLKCEIPLNVGRNEVDADVWKEWLEMHKDSPLVTSGILKTEERPDGKREDHQDSDGSSRSHTVEGEVRDGGVEVGRASGDPAL